MLHDPIRPTEAVDSDAAMEFMKEATKLATATELEDIGQRLEAKSARFRAALAAERIDSLDADEFRGLLGSMFSLRRKSGRLLKRNDFGEVRREIGELLYGGAPVAGRFDRFVDRVQGLERAMIVSMASEMLHFNDPEQHWLWTHWIWNPGTQRGALPLVIQDKFDLQVEGSGATYARVGEATARVNALGHAIGYSRSGKGLFGTDVFLACVYSVYMFTVFRVKLSQEFNRILPELPELVQRVLGVHRTGGDDGLV